MNNNNQSSLRPDFGKFYKEEYGETVKYDCADFYLDHISYVQKNLFTTSSNLIFDGKEFCISLDISSELVNLLLGYVNDEVFVDKVKEDLMSKRTSNFDDKLVNLGFCAHLGKLETGVYEDFIPFIADEFYDIKLISKENQIKLLIPEKITHVMMQEDSPVGLAVQFSKHDKDYPNTIEAYVCIYNMPMYSELGSIHTFKNYEEAKHSIAWQIEGKDLWYATDVKNLTDNQILKTNILYESYKENFIEGFKRKGIVF